MKVVSLLLFFLIPFAGVFCQNTYSPITSLDQIQSSSNAHYVITQDIDASSFSSSISSFSGILEAGVKSDGTFYKITGLSQPLFVQTDGAIIRNLVLENVQISRSGNVGAIVMTASGNTRIYNCGILSGSVGSTDGYCGGLVGYLADKSRVVNCYSFADITGGTTVAGLVGYNSFASNDYSGDKQETLPNLKTMVMNCMFYGDITGGNSRYPVYGGVKILNKGTNGINNYDYYRSEASLGTLADYNCSWPAEEKNLTRFEYYRSILNSNRELASWYISAEDLNKRSPKDTTLIAKWVLDPSIKPYPILKRWGKYPSIVNADPQRVWDETSQTWVDRANAADFQGKALGTLSVVVNPGEHNSGADAKTITLTVTDMDTLHYDYGYAKVQLPYYNELFGDPSSDDHATRYGNNYTGMAVTGWKVTAVTGGTPGNFVADWESGYDFADRYCTQKDLYEVSGRVFAQGGYYYVPEGVTSITIEAYWGKAVYLSSNQNRYDIISHQSTPFMGAGTRPNQFAGQNVKTTFKGAISDFSGRTEEDGKTVYDNAIILLGNYIYRGGKNNDDLGYFLDQKKVPYTVMSLDLNLDNEPDYCLMLQKGDGSTRYRVNPIRFDFVPYIRLGMAMKEDGTQYTYGIGLCLLKGHFEVTETAFAEFGEFEYDNRKDFGQKTEAPLILNGGSIRQIVTCENNLPNDLSDKTSYIILGGHHYMKAFNPGPHNSRKYKNRHCAVNVIGGQIDQLTLSGNYRADADVHPDNPHCYVNGGRMKLVAGAGQEKIDGDVTFKIDHAVIDEFYGGGMNAAKPISGNIDVTIDHSLVRKYCGGPMFGDMAQGKTVTTKATGSTFGVFYGAGNGGTNYRLAKSKDNQGGLVWTSLSEWQFGEYNPANYDGTNHDYAAKYDFEMMNVDAGDKENVAVCRFYVYNAQFAVTATGSVTSTLTDCVVETDYYGGGNLGSVSGDVNSTLRNTHVLGSAFGGGFSADVPTVDIYGTNPTPPQRDAVTNIITPAVLDGYDRYYWTNETSLGGQTLSTSNPRVTVDGVGYFYTEKSLANLGSISGNTTITVNGSSVIEGNLFGAGNESAVMTNTNTVVDGQALVKGNVYGGGNVASAGGDTYVNLKSGTVGVAGANDSSKGNLFGGGKGSSDDLSLAQVSGNTNVEVSGGTVAYNVYGGGEVGSVSGKAIVRLVNGATLNNVFGAGKGVENYAEREIANVKQGTDITLVNGHVKGSIYGGGENGSVGFGAKDNTEGASVVTLVNGRVSGSVFGGGSMGYTNGNTIVNISDGVVVDQNIFGGAFGARGKVYVAGLRMVNMRGGTVYGSVYGGSRNADDALVFEPGDFDESTETSMTSAVNISGGHVAKQVFASGYFGNVYGSTSVYIGTNAIMNAPNHTSTTDGTYNESFYANHKAIVLDGSVWAGGDFGNYDGHAFGAPTITGRSDIYVDGTGYKTDADTPSTDDDYMDIYGSLYGCGTSCDAGRQGRYIVVRAFGELVANEDYRDGYVEPYTSATRSLYSIQRADSLAIDASHINFLGQGLVNSLITTEKYAIHEFGSVVRVANGSSLFLDYPIEQVKKVGSYVCDDVYAKPVYAKVENTDLPVSGHDNKIRINNGSYMAVRYNETSETYGELEGFMYVMTDAQNNTVAYARPKQSMETGNIIPDGYDNPNDGGLVSYIVAYNIYTLDGTLVSEGSSMQLRYENHTPDMRDDSPYFRVWRYGDIYSHRDGVFNAIAVSEDGFSTVDVLIDLPASGGANSYFRIKSFEGVPSVYYGTDVKTVNAGCYGTTSAEEWMYYDRKNKVYTEGVGASNDSVVYYSSDMLLNPNNTFGLVAIPQGSLVGSYNDNILFHPYADARMIAEQWYNVDNTANPSVLFRLTYNNKLTGNFTWEPMTIVLEQVKVVDGNTTIIDEVTISLVINTSTSIEQDITAQSFALMRGKGTVNDTYTTKVMVPSYLLHMTELGELSRWYLTGVKWSKREPYEAETTEVPYVFVGDHDYVGSTEQFGMTLKPSLNVDHSSGWSNNVNVISPLDAYTYLDNTDNDAYYLGETDGRYSIAFDFVLNFDGTHYGDNDYMGLLEFDLYLTNYKNGDAEHDYREDFKIYVEVYRRGQGTRYYIDGVNGRNDFSGTYPNAAKPNLAGILYFTDFLPGDEIYIVNTVTVEAGSALNWYGQDYGQLTLYRYPGGHKFYVGVDHQQYWDGYDTENNQAFLGTLLDVEGTMNISAVTLDGSSIVHSHHGYDDDPAVQANAPLITVENGGALEVFGNSCLLNNYNASTNGGAVAVSDNSSFTIYDGSSIIDNTVVEGQGGGVYLAPEANMMVSDVVTINDNHQGTVLDNVYLSDYNTVITVGTANPNDSYEALDATSKIGITKLDWGEDDYYMPVLYSDAGMDYLNDLARSAVVFDDQSLYVLEKLEPVDPENHLYFVVTWTTVQHTEPVGFDATAIDTPEELAWVISLVNGLNGQTAQPGLSVKVTGDIDMGQYIWDVIGDTDCPFSGEFSGNGHYIQGIHSLLVRDNMGMFGKTDGATISDMVVNAAFADGTAQYMGAVVGTMEGGSLSNVEVAGSLEGDASTLAMGGLVGKSNGLIHSSFAVNTLTAGNTDTDMGGLVGVNNANLINAYSYVTMSGADAMAGLVGVNNGRVENCYSNRQNHDILAFAVENYGKINYCYFNKEDDDEDGQINYTPSGTGTVSGIGYYAMVPKTGVYHYMYHDNIVHIIKNDNSYFSSALTYANNQIDRWPGLLSTLNYWVKQNSGDVAYTSWLRPTTKDINDDLPLLCFDKDNCLATTDGKLLHYGSNVVGNGLDALLSTYAEQSADLFLYGNATDVANVPGANVNVFINEDAALLQSGTGEFINTTVGVSFDNSCKTASDYWGTTLAYDWHLMSTPLKDAPLGITYNSNQHNWWDEEDSGQISSVSGGYLPDGIANISHWDFYCYDEPDYHWINFKRNSSSHYHYDEPHAQITYDNETTLIPGKGYMAAIDLDSYLSNTGTLNNGNVTIELTCTEDPASDVEPSKDWGSNLVGNPYQAYLDLNKVAEGTYYHNFYIYEAEWGIYVPFSYTASTNPVTPSRFIHPHQAFFVLKDKGDPEDFTFTYSMASSQKETGSYLRESEYVNYPVVDIFVSDDEGHRDLAIIELDRPELGGARKTNALRNANFKLSAYYDGNDYGLLFTPQGAERIPVHFTTTEDGTYTMTWTTCNGDFTSLLLVDNLTGTHVDMLHSDSYTFVGTADDYAARFYITFNCTGIEEYDTSNGVDFAYYDGNEWVVNGEGELQLVDMTGRVLQSQVVAGDQVRVHFDGYASGVYVLRLGNGTSVRNQKIILW